MTSSHTDLARDRTAPSTRRLRPELCALLVACIPAAWVVSYNLWRDMSGHVRLTLFDDAMVSMSYARTLAEGDGLVWYPGADRVEGYTNPLWTLVMALAHMTRLPTDGVIGLIVVLSLATVFAAALASARIGRRHFGLVSSRSRFALTLVVAGNYPLLFWAGRGMEVGLITLLTICLVTVLLEQRKEPTRRLDFATLAIVAAGLATRMDFVVVVGAAVLWLLLSPGSRRATVPMLLGGAVGLGTTTAFRVAYYGELLPNTYYLKLFRVPLSTRLVSGIEVDVLMAIACLAALALAAATATHSLIELEARSAAGLLALTAAAQVTYSTYVGGDAWEEFLIPNRYLTPAAVCLAIVAVAGVGSSLESSRLTARQRMMVLVSVGLALLGPVAVSNQHIPALALAGAATAGAAVGITAKGQAVLGPLLAIALAIGAALGGLNIPGNQLNHGPALGAQLAEVTLPGTTIAVTAAGGSQYFSRRPMVDLLGKMDAVVAHEQSRAGAFKPGHSKWDYAYSIGHLRPDVVAQIWVADDEDLMPMLKAGRYRPMKLRTGSFTRSMQLGAEWVILVRPEARVRRSLLVPIPAPT